MDWQKDDYYALLGVTRMAQEDEIRRAYRRKALDFHPDRFPLDSSERERAEALFLQITEARDTLLDSERREAYDREQTLLQQAWLDANRQHFDFPITSPPKPQSNFKETLKKAFDQSQEDSDFHQADYLVDDQGARIYTPQDDALDEKVARSKRSHQNSAAFFYAQGMRYAARGQYRRAWYALSNAQMLDPEIDIPAHVMYKIRTYAYYNKR